MPDYEDRIAAAGRIDLQLLGSAAPATSASTSPCPLSKPHPLQGPHPGTIAQNSPLFDSPEEMPRRAITMGVGTILDSRRCIMLVTGEAKANILSKGRRGPITSMISATALQLHPDAPSSAMKPPPQSSKTAATTTGSSRTNPSGSPTAKGGKNTLPQGLSVEDGERTALALQRDYVRAPSRSRSVIVQAARGPSKRADAKTCLYPFFTYPSTSCFFRRFQLLHNHLVYTFAIGISGEKSRPIREFRGWYLF